MCTIEGLTTSNSKGKIHETLQHIPLKNVVVNELYALQIYYSEI